MMIPGMSISSLVSANRAPNEEISNSSIGILVVDQAPMKMRIFLNLTPFFMKTAATGKAPYNGPAAADPIRIANTTPFNPDPSPMYLTMVSLGTQMSSNPSRMNIGGMTSSISFNWDSVMPATDFPNATSNSE